MYRMKIWCFGAILLFVSCGAPMEKEDPLVPEDPDPSLVEFDKLMEEIDKALEDPCGEGADALFVKAGGSWRFQPCEGCESIPIEMYWGGNTGQHRELEKSLDSMSVEVSSEKISPCEYEKHTGESP